MGTTRLPYRVSEPSWLLLVVGALVVGHAGPSARRGTVARAAAGLAVVLAGWQAVTLVDRAVDRSEHHQARQERAERLLDQLEALGGPDAVFVLWLVDPWVVVDPLDGDGPDRYRVTSVEVAGWGSTLPSYRDMRRALGLEDWIGAVATDDLIFLVASPERVERFQTLLRERRGLLCTEPRSLSVVNDGFDVLVQGFAAVPCAGVTIAP